MSRTRPQSHVVTRGRYEAKRGAPSSIDQASAYTAPSDILALYAATLILSPDPQGSWIHAQPDHSQGQWRAYSLEPSHLNFIKGDGAEP